MEYTIRIKQNLQSGWLIGQCEEMPEAITQGRDMDELMFMMEDAIGLDLECRREEFHETFIDTNTFVRKLIIGNEKKFIDKTFGRKELCSV
jgi:predicted RNase H-like HicB family nuclease